MERYKLYDFNRIVDIILLPVDEVNLVAFIYEILSISQAYLLRVTPLLAFATDLPR
jgi:hypothetical protein